MRLTLLPSVVLFAAMGGLSSCHNGGGDSEAIKFLEQHANDPDALNDKFGGEAQSACTEGANDYLRQVEANDFSWDEDAKEVNGQRFDKVLSHSEAPYVLTLLSTRAKLSNSFGAFRHISLYCSYNIQRKKVLSYSLDNPLLLKLAEGLKSNNKADKKLNYDTALDDRPKNPEPVLSPPSSAVEPLPTEDNNDLNQQAANFLSKYYHIAEQNPEQAIPWMLAHYSPVVNFFGKPQALNQIVVQKRNYITRWPIRSYKLLPDTIGYQCDKINMSCQVTGTLEFEAQSPERNAFSKGEASFVLSVDFSGNTPQITSENSQVISR